MYLCMTKSTQNASIVESALIAPVNMNGLWALPSRHFFRTVCKYLRVMQGVNRLRGIVCYMY